MYTWNMKALSQKLLQRLKFLEMKDKGNAKGHKVINHDFNWKCCISWVYMPNMKSISVTVQKLSPMLKFLDM